MKMMIQKRGKQNPKLNGPNKNNQIESKDRRTLDIQLSFKEEWPENGKDIIYVSLNPE